jgi:hypothetical protein
MWTCSNNSNINININKITCKTYIQTGQPLLLKHNTIHDILKRIQISSVQHIGIRVYTFIAIHMPKAYFMWFVSIDILCFAGYKLFKICDNLLF